MQEVALAGLQRAGFFEKAAFYGGLHYVYFYGLDRYSEDLDFFPVRNNPGFALDKYLTAEKTELNRWG